MYMYIQYSKMMYWRMTVVTWWLGGVGLILSMCEDMGRILSWSSITIQWWQSERDSRNLQTDREREKERGGRERERERERERGGEEKERERDVHTKLEHNIIISSVFIYLSLNLAVSSWWASVLYRECTSMASVYSCFSDDIVLSNRTTTPPPSTVSMVRAKRLGVSASKSYKNSK